MPAHSQTNFTTIRLAWIAVALAIPAIVIVLQETFLSMVHQWENSASYKYCYLIPPAALYLAWIRRDKLIDMIPRASARGVFASFAATAVWIAGYLTGIDAIQQVAAIAIIGFSFWAALGTGIARVMIYPLFYLLLMVPAGGFLISPLMEWTADFTQFATRASGVPIYRDGMFLSIPEGRFYVAEACGGLRSFLVFAATGVFFAGIIFQSPLRRAIYIAISLVVPLIANGIRAYGIVMLGHISDMRWPENHLLFGDLWFGFVLLSMCLLGRRYSDLNPERMAAPASKPVATAMPGAVWRSPVFTGVSILIVSLAPVFGTAIQQKLDDRPLKAFPDLPAKTDPWTLLTGTDTDWAPAFLNATKVSAGQYRSGDQQIDVHIISYAAKSDGAELINSVNRFFDQERWRLVEKRADEAMIAPGNSLPYVGLSIRSNTHQEHSRAVWYWYLTEEGPAIDPFLIKIRETMNLFSAERSVSSVIALSTPANDGVAQARIILDGFLASFCVVAADDEPDQTSLCGP